MLPKILRHLLRLMIVCLLTVALIINPFNAQRLAAAPLQVPVTQTEIHQSACYIPVLFGRARIAGVLLITSVLVIMALAIYSVNQRVQQGVITLGQTSRNVMNSVDRVRSAQDAGELYGEIERHFTDKQRGDIEAAKAKVTDFLRGEEYEVDRRAVFEELGKRLPGLIERYPTIMHFIPVMLSEIGIPWHDIEHLLPPRLANEIEGEPDDPPSNMRDELANSGQSEATPGDPNDPDLEQDRDNGREEFEITDSTRSSLRNSASREFKDGLSYAGRAYQKHNPLSRPGSVFPRPPPRGGNPMWNRTGQNIVDDILNNPRSSVVRMHDRPEWGRVIEIRGGQYGGGVRYKYDTGELLGFLEPAPL